MTSSPKLAARVKYAGITSDVYDAPIPRLPAILMTRSPLTHGCGQGAEADQEAARLRSTPHHQLRGGRRRAREDHDPQRLQKQELEWEEVEERGL
jgi:hypothetical protein